MTATPSVTHTSTADRLKSLYRESREFLLHHGACPYLADDGQLEVAIVSESGADVLDEIAFVLDEPVRRRTAPLDEVERMVERCHAEAREAGAVSLEEGTAATDVRGMASEPPVIRYVSLLLREAERARASDIHLEEDGNGLLVRFRIDGVLHRALAPAPELGAAVLSRLKLLADLDLAERRRPQDGRFRARMLESHVDIRLSTVPTLFGESVVLRILDKGDRPSTLGELGMREALTERMRAAARLSHGLILVTGPTGSGKTTTLYALMRERTGLGEKLITLEDPVEYQLPGVTQVPVARQQGVTFATALRALLRQDPDVILIGEMRDEETARVAVQAALTGHLVFATVHTNDAAGAASRLLDLGLPSYLIRDTLAATLAQRLVRRVCTACSTLEPLMNPPDFLSESVRPRSVPKALGCDECRGTGYAGRVGVFELVLPRPKEPGESEDGGGTSFFEETTLLQDAWRRILAGVTTVEEVSRVLSH